MLGPELSCILTDAYKSYEAYCEQIRERPKSCKQWLIELGPKGVRKDSQYGLRVVLGLGML